MITLKCICSRSIQVPEDQAGNSVQCTYCGHLMDVPLLSDLANIDEDGSYRIADEPAMPANQMAEFVRIYQPGTRDEKGRPIDLRGPVHPEKPAKPPIPSRAPAIIPAAAPQADLPRPRVGVSPIYDPESGKRIDAFELSKTAPPLPHEIPMAKLNLSYSTAEVRGYRPYFGLYRILLEMLHPLNLLVMAFLCVGHLGVMVAAVLFAPLGWVMPLFRWVILSPLLAIVLGHYGNVIEDVGLDDRDVLPRPLRNLSLAEDILSPFYRICLALLVSFWPAILYAFISPAFVTYLHGLDMALFLLGEILLPAALITAFTSNHLFDLLPHRQVRVILQCGLSYFGAFLLGIVVVNLTLWLHVGATHIQLPTDIVDTLISWQFTNGDWVFIELPLYVYLLHAFTFDIGMLYRRNQDQFDWNQPIAKPVAHPTPAAGPSTGQ